MEAVCLTLLHDRLFLAHLITWGDGRPSCRAVGGRIMLKSLLKRQLESCGLDFSDSGRGPLEIPVYTASSLRFP